jgi:vacuolar-type H+-ATPase subunit E/Vma4
MALQQLLDALREQAAERRDAERARADAQVEEIRTRSRMGLDRRRSDFIRQAREEERAAAHRAIAQAQSEAAERLLTSRARLLQRVRHALERRLATATDDPDYRLSLQGVLWASLERLPVGAIVVRTSPGLESALIGAVGGRGSVRVEPVPGMGTGFSALSAETGLEIDATLETELHHAWPRLAVAVMREVGA